MKNTVVPPGAACPGSSWAILAEAAVPAGPGSLDKEEVEPTFHLSPFLAPEDTVWQPLAMGA